jgi:Tfp pilus assembly protein FimV
MAAPLAIVGIGASLVGGVVSAYGAEAKGQADQAMYNYQAGVAKLKAQIAQQNAEYAVRSGGSAAYQSGLKTGETVGVQKAAQGASGVDVNTGSTKAVRDTTTQLGEYDQQLIRENYAKKAYGYEVERETKTAEAGADVVAGEQAKKAGDINAFASILGSVGSVASKWTSGSSAGIF